MGSTSTKFVKGSEYLYYVYYENRVKREIYCGLASKPQSKRKALELELESIRSQKETLDRKADTIRKKMKNLNNK